MVAVLPIRQEDVAEEEAAAGGHTVVSQEPPSPYVNNLAIASFSLHSKRADRLSNNGLLHSVCCCVILSVEKEKETYSPPTYAGVVVPNRQQEV